MKLRGFTLIEVLIVITIIGVLALVAIPLSGRWVQNADLQETEGHLIEAIGRAKAIAQRNAAGMTSGAAASAVCISTATKLLTLRASTTAAAASCSTPAGDLVWEAQMDMDVAVTIGTTTTALTCMCFDNKGLLTTTGCGGCSTGSTFKLTTGPANETISVY